MTTAEAIDGISDAGNFEILGVRVLRELDPDCKQLEHLGVNAAGKTRKNPIDAFTEVPGSIPPTYVMAQFATSAVDDLEEKWLFDHSVANARAKAKSKVPKKVESDDGDLLKAARAAEGIRQAAPTAAFKLWLCSNRVVDPDLRTKVSNVARARGITVEFLTQTGLRDFLDTTPEGHWLRKLHLGIAAKLLSKEQLQEIGRASVDSYAADIAATYQTKFVPTSNLDSLGRTISQRGSTLIFVVGPSGSGKSVLVCQRLRACDAAGGCVLKISERLVEQSDSLAEAVEKALVNLSPDLESGCGRAALEIARQSELTIAVDDINRAASPLRLVEKLVAWTAKPSSSGGTSQGITAPMVTVLCPIWESVWKAVYKRYANEPRIAQYQVQRMMKTEAVALLRETLAASAAKVHDYQLEEVADRLAFDPILLAIFAIGTAAREAVAPTGATPASAVIAQYEEECFDALELGCSIAKSEFRASVSRVSEIMLRERNFYPRWEFLTAEMANEPQLLNPLRILITDRRICRLVDQGGFEQLEFRHDRILAFMLARKIAAELRGSSTSEYLHDPYYVRLVGEALAAGQLPRSVVDATCGAIPPAIFAALAATQSGTEAETDFGRRAKAWLVSPEGYAAALLAVQEQAVAFLEEANSKEVAKVVPSGSPMAVFARALLRNGDLSAALYSVADYPGGFLPATQYDRLETDIEHAMTRHGSSLVRELSHLLETETEPKRISAGLTLAGYIALPGLQSSVLHAVSRNHDEDMLLPSLWSILRCAKTDYEDTLRGLIERWAKLPDPGHRGYGFTERQAATQTVRFFCRKGLRPEMIRFLVAHGQLIPIAGEILASALSEVDQPEAITLALQNGIVSDEWNLIMPNARHLSDASRAALRKHWEDSSQDSESRRRAFRLWLNSTTDSKEFLGLVLPDDAWLGSLLWRRCVLRDVSAATDLAARIHQDPFRLHVAHHIWCPVVAQAVDAFMGVVATRFAAKAGGDNDDHTYHLAELLRDIPVAESEPLLLKHWHGLSSVPKFIQAALYIGTPELLARADAAIELHADKTEALVHVGIFFGFIMRGLSERVTSNHIRTLVHYREILPDSEIRHVTSHCLATESMRTHLPSLRKVVEKRAEHAPAGSPASENRRRLFPTEAELFAEFDQAAASQFPGWLDRFETRIESKEALWAALQKWAMADLANRYAEFARAAMLCATRSELLWLTRIPLEQLDENQRREREDALHAVRMRSLN